MNKKEYIGFKAFEYILNNKDKELYNLKYGFRMKLRQRGNYNKNSPLDFEQILLNSGVKDISNFKFVSKDTSQLRF